MSKLPMDTHSDDGSHFKLDEQFEHLPNAPIVEAVIHWLAPAGKPLYRTFLRDAISDQFPNYECSEQQEFRADLEASPDGQQFRQQTRWDGFRLKGIGNADRYIVQIKPDGIVFSRLAPYLNWNIFLEAAWPFWQFYLKSAVPPAIQRLGVRFINQIRLEENRRASYFLKGLPKLPTGLDWSPELFLYQDRFRVSETPYRINWVRTAQPETPTDRLLFVDIDVSIDQVPELDQAFVNGHLAKMRTIKNRLFFSCMTKQAIQQFRKKRDE